MQGQGKTSGKHMPYGKEHFSIVVGDLLTTKGERLTATKLRHMFITMWLDYMQDLTSIANKMVVDELGKATSSMMLNSLKVWSAYYDDANFDRCFLSTLTHWDKFQKFVEEKHLDKESEKPIDASTFDFFSLLTSSI